MKKQLLLTMIFSMLIILEIDGQIIFQKKFGTGIGRNVRQTTDGGFIITGLFSNLGNGDVCLIKTNANGDTLWTKGFGGSGIDEGFSVQQTTDGGYIITGSTESFGAGGDDVYLIKTDSNGNALWAWTFGGTGNDRGFSVQQTTDGGYIVAGSLGGINTYLIKTDPNGDSLWTKSFGGSGFDESFSVQQTTDGGYILVGYTFSFGAGSTDVYLIKTDVNGNLIWSKTFGGTADEKGNFVQQTTDGGYIIAATTFSFGAGTYDVYLIKTNNSGDSLWTKTYGGVNFDEGYSVQQTVDGGYIVTGKTTSFGTGLAGAYLIKTDSNGNTVWSKTFGGTTDEYANFAQQTTDGGYIITGYNGSGIAIYLIKTDSIGNSGCNQVNSATITSSTTTQVDSPATIVTSLFTLVISPVTLVGSGCTVTTLCTTGYIIEIESEDNLVLTPNPFSGKINIIAKANALVEVNFYDVTGRKILNQSFTNTISINTEQLAKGIYFYEVRNKNSVIEKGKIVKPACR